MASGRFGPTVEWVRRIAGDGGIPDGELLQRYLSARDEAAFELLVWRHRRLVFGVCRRVLQDAQDAEDAFQAAFLVLARKAATIGRRESLAAWLYRVAYRSALTARRVRTRRASRERPLAAAGEPAELVGALSVSERREVRSVIDEEMARLPEPFRAPALLCFLSGKTVEEAAAHLGCPRGTVASRLARARQRLRLRLAGRGVALSAAVAALAFGRGATASASESLIRSTLHLVRDKVRGSGPTAPGAVAIAERMLRAMFLRKLFTTVAVLILLGGLLSAGSVLALPSPDQPPAAPPPPAKPAPAKPDAGPVVPPKKPQPGPSEEFVGRLEASEVIEIAVIVGGVLDKVHVKEGEAVKKGDLLFELNSAPARAQLDVATASLDQAKARQAVAAAALERGKKIFDLGALAQAELEQLTADAAAASAATAIAEATLRQARLNLEATRILAAVAGRISRIHVTAGDTVAGGARAQRLATLNVVDPMGLRFEMDELTYARFLKLRADGQVKEVDIRFAIAAAEEKGYPHRATLKGFANQVDPKSGTVAVHAALPNPKGLLVPGMFVRIRVTFVGPEPKP
jgi:RND family efflux transporter MFP subunit